MNQQKLTNKGGYSKYKGVTWDKRRNKWMAKICKNYKTFHVGYFDTEEEASEAYNRRAIEIFEEFAQLNYERRTYLPSFLQPNLYKGSYKAPEWRYYTSPIMFSCPERRLPLL